MFSACRPDNCFQTMAHMLQKPYFANTWTNSYKVCVFARRCLYHYKKEV